MDDSVGLRPRVSAVVPTYGRPDRLSRALRSVEAQRYDPVELVVVDDHSPEPAQPVVDRLDDAAFERIVYRRHGTNRGANAARKTGIEAATGRYIAFLDDDDEWDRRYLQRVVSRFESASPTVGLVTAGAVVLDGDGEVQGTLRPTVSGDGIEALLSGAVVGSFSRFVVRSRAVEAVGPPDERLPNWQDWEWQFRLGRRFRFASVSEPLVRRRVAGHEQLTDDFRKRRDVSYPLLLERYEQTMRERGGGSLRRFRALLLRSLAASALRNGYYGHAVRYLCRSAVADPTRAETYAYLLSAVGGPVTYYGLRELRRRVASLTQSADVEV